MYLQTRNLIFGTVARKFAQLKDLLHELSITNGPCFQDHALNFLKISEERMALGRRLRNNDLIDPDESLNERISKFIREIKTPFMAQLITELDTALQLNDPVFLAFDVFNVTTTFTENIRIQNIKVLSNFYGSAQSSKLKGDTIKATPLIQNSGSS